MMDIFRAMPPEARRENLAAYQQFLLARDGVLDLEKRTLSHREQGMTRYSKPLHEIRALDRELFEAQYSRFDSAVPTTEEMLLLLALVKVNAAEAFGVHTTFEKALQRAVANDDTLEVTLLVEELYHTRILLSSAVLYGLEINAPYKPPQGLRAILFGIGRAPQFLSRPLILAGEILGALGFLGLLRKTGQILRHDPELRDAIEERICEIMVDELGHISFNRMLLGRNGISRTRAMLPLVAKGLEGAVPEIGVLGIMPAWSETEIASLGGGGLPEHVRRAAFLA